MPTTTTIQVEDFFEHNFSYLCLYNFEDELLDYFANPRPMNDNYLQAHQDILDSGFKDVKMVFTDAHDKTLIGMVDEDMIDKVYLATMIPSEFIKTYPELFLPEED